MLVMLLNFIILFCMWEYFSTTISTYMEDLSKLKKKIDNIEKRLLEDDHK